MRGVVESLRRVDRHHDPPGKHRREVGDQPIDAVYRVINAHRLLADKPPERIAHARSSIRRNTRSLDVGAASAVDAFDHRIGTRCRERRQNLSCGSVTLSLSSNAMYRRSPVEKADPLTVPANTAALAPIAIASFPQRRATRPASQTYLFARVVRRCDRRSHVRFPERPTTNRRPPAFSRPARIRSIARPKAARRRRAAFAGIACGPNANDATANRTIASGSWPGVLPARQR